MQTTESPSLADRARALSAERVAGRRHLYRLLDLHAGDEAAAALRRSVSAAPEGIGRNVLEAAVTILEGERESRVPGAEDLEAWDRLREAVTMPELSLMVVPGWIHELRELAASRPDTGACTIGSALELWLWTAKHFLSGAGAGDESAAHAIDDLTEAICPLLAARAFAIAVETEESRSNPVEATFIADLCHLNAGRASASTGATCAELVFGYRQHLKWDAEGCATCYAAEELDDLESLVPGISSGARMAADVIETDGSHPSKAGPCVRFEGVDSFVRLRGRLDGCLTGARIARDRAVAEIARSLAATAKPSKGSK